MTITRIVNTLVLKNNHKFCLPITVPEDYNPETDLSSVSFSSDYISGPWLCWRCNHSNASSVYTCSRCRTRRLTEEQVRFQQRMNQRIENIFDIPKELSITGVEIKREKDENVHVFLRLVKSGMLGLLVMLIMRRLEPRRNKYWFFVSVVLAFISYVTNWPNFK